MESGVELLSDELPELGDNGVLLLPILTAGELSEGTRDGAEALSEGMLLAEGDEAKEESDDFEPKRSKLLGILNDEFIEIFIHIKNRTST